MALKRKFGYNKKISYKKRKFAGPSKLKKSYKKKFTPKSSLYKAIKSVNMRMKELKWKDYGSSSEVDIKHNVYVNYTLLLNQSTGSFFPAQGDTSHTRDGNEIYLVGQTVRIMLKFFQDRLNGKALVHVIRVPKGQSVGAYEDVYDSITQNKLLDPYDKDKVKVVYRKVIYPGVMNPGVATTGKEVTRFCKFFIPYKQKLRFTGDADYTHNMAFDYHLQILAYDSAGTLTTDSVCTAMTYIRTQWRDI